MQLTRMMVAKSFGTSDIGTFGSRQIAWISRTISRIVRTFSNNIAVNHGRLSSCSLIHRNRRRVHTGMLLFFVGMRNWTRARFATGRTARVPSTGSSPVVHAVQLVATVLIVVVHTVLVLFALWLARIWTLTRRRWWRCRLWHRKSHDPAFGFLDIIFILVIIIATSLVD